MGEHFARSRNAALVVLTIVAAMVVQVDCVRAQDRESIEAYLLEIRELAETALEASERAEEAQTVADVKKNADEVFQTVWGIPSGLTDGNAGGAENAHGWKTRWQVTYSDFDSAFAARYGSAPPEIGDPARLGIIGCGRYVRDQLTSIIDDSTRTDPSVTHSMHVVTSLNNVIGWMKMDDGVTKGERQPRVDLTREWDSPIEFWMSTSDTGWLQEVYSQALNILKTDYGQDVAMAREHASGMTQLIHKVLDGVDANGNGSVEPTKMEGGMTTALQHANLAGFLEE